MANSSSEGTLAGFQDRKPSKPNNIPLPFTPAVYHRSFFGLFQLILDSCLKSFQGPGPGDPAIDEDGGGASHSHIGPEPDILVDPCNDLEIVDVLFKSLQVQTKLAGNLPKLLVVQGGVILE